MSEIPESTIEAAVKAIMSPDFFGRPDLAIRAALQAALDEGGVVLASKQFGPIGDNHHNAAMCPYCSPDRERYIESERRIRAAAHVVMGRIEGMKESDLLRRALEN